MKRNSIISGVLIGVFTSLPVIALTLVAAWLANTPPLPLDIFDWMARTLPGAVISFGIDTMVKLIRFLQLGPTASTAKLAEQIMGLVSFVVLGGLFGAILALVGRRRHNQLPDDGLRLGLVFALAMILIEGSLGFRAGALITIVWIAALFLSWGIVLGWLLRGPALALQPADENPRQPGSTVLTRRDFLYLGAASAAAVLISAISLENLRREIPSTGGAAPAPDLEALTIGRISGPTNIVPEKTLAARFPLAPGTRPELTANSDFYRIDIDTFPPVIDASSWRLILTGMVNKSLSLSLDEIRSRPSISQALTMQCISNPVGGDLTGTTIWTGVPFKDILAEAGLQPGVKGIYIEAKDGFYEFVPLQDAMDPRTLLVYAMNGVPLPVEHGFPLRIYIPNRYGMKQPKWIIRMEAMSEERPGYWVDRGWDHDAIVKTTSVVDTIAVDHAIKDSQDPQKAIIPVGGIAWAGDRGISKVEVQVDEGPWVPANIRQPSLSPLTWVQWRYDWVSQPGNHRFSVRAYDGTGALQETAPNPPEPGGATGISSKQVFILPNGG